MYGALERLQHGSPSLSATLSSIWGCVCPMVTKRRRPSHSDCKREMPNFSRFGSSFRTIATQDPKPAANLVHDGLGHSFGRTGRRRANRANCSATSELVRKEDTSSSKQAGTFNRVINNASTQSTASKTHSRCSEIAKPPGFNPCSGV